MAQGSRLLTIAMVVVIAGFLQVLLVFADCKNTPSRTAVAFTKAHFRLDPSMGDLLCSEITKDEDADPVGDFLHDFKNNARLRGFRPNALRSTLYNVHTETQMKDDSTAQVRITADRREALNPVFSWIAKLFFLGQTYHVDTTLDLVKEDGKWKVCGQPDPSSA